MKIVTSITLWNDAIGKRMSVTYSTIDEETGHVTADNLRADRIITEQTAKDTMDDIMAYAQAFVDTQS